MNRHPASRRHRLRAFAAASLAALALGAAPHAAAQACRDPGAEPGRFLVSGLEFTDTRTGLVWARCLGLAVTAQGQCDEARTLPAETHAAALDPPRDPASLTALPGAWRLPTVEEIEAIVARDCPHQFHPSLLAAYPAVPLWTRSAGPDAGVWQVDERGRRVRGRPGNALAWMLYVRSSAPEDAQPRTLRPRPVPDRPAPSAAPRAAAEPSAAAAVASAAAAAAAAAVRPPVPTAAAPAAPRPAAPPAAADAPVAESPPRAAAGNATSERRQELQSAYYWHLQAEGYRPQMSQLGNVVFTRQGRRYIVLIDEADPAYFRVELVFEPESGDAQRRRRRMEATNAATAATKAVKAYLRQDGSLVFAGESLHPAPDDANRTLGRVLDAIDYALEQYRKELSARQ